MTRRAKLVVLGVAHGVGALFAFGCVDERIANRNGMSNVIEAIRNCREADAWFSEMKTVAFDMAGSPHLGLRVPGRPARSRSTRDRQAETTMTHCRSSERAVAASPATSSPRSEDSAARQPLSYPAKSSPVTGRFRPIQQAESAPTLPTKETPC